MANDFPRQLWVAFKIWVLAVCANTILGTLYLGSEGMIPLLLIYGTLFGGMYSFPVFILLVVIINRGVVKKVNGLFLFRLVFISGLILTAAVWKWFMLTSSDFPTEHIAFLFIALLSAIIAIACQHKSLFKLAAKKNLYDDFLAGQGAKS